MSSILFRLYWTIISMFFDIFSSFRFLRVVWSFDYVFPHVFWFLLGGLGWFFGFFLDLFGTVFFSFCVFFEIVLNGWICFFNIWFWFFEIFWVVGLLLCLSAFCMRADGISHPLTESECSESTTPHVGVSHHPPPHWGRGVTALRRAPMSKYIYIYPPL